MSKKALVLIGVMIMLMGVGGLIPSLEIGTEPIWHALIKIAVGIGAILVGAIDKSK